MFQFLCLIVNIVDTSSTRGRGRVFEADQCLLTVVMMQYCRGDERRHYGYYHQQPVRKRQVGHALSLLKLDCDIERLLLV
eukprot:scaffold23394_cov42-Cyclotella_meneghiniana.AAC.8